MGQQFKVGDRVQLAGLHNDRFAQLSAHVGLANGMVGTIREEDSDRPFVDWDNFEGGHDFTFNDGRKSCWAVSVECLAALSTNEGGR
jgi:hypothetical protein